MKANIVKKQQKNKPITFYLDPESIKFIDDEMNSICCTNRSWFLNQLLAEIKLERCNYVNK